MFLITMLQATSAPMPPQPSMLDSLLMFLPALVIIYFVMLRPQHKKMKKHRELVANVSRGDQVVTNGGLVGKVSKVNDDEVIVELAENVRVRVMKYAISDIKSKTEPAKKSSEKKTDDKK